MEAAALASLARKLEALYYVVPAEGLPACSGPLLEQARALRSSPPALAAGEVQLHRAMFLATPEP